MLWGHCLPTFVVVNMCCEYLTLCHGPFVAIPFYLPSSMFALKRGGEDGSATIADAFDVCGFGLLAVFNGFVARVLDVSGEAGSAAISLSIHK